MSYYKLDYEQKYKDESIELIISLSPIPTKRQFKKFREHFFNTAQKLEGIPSNKKKQRDLEFKKYRAAIDGFIYKRRKLSDLLEGSEISYGKLPFLCSDKDFTQELREKERILEKYLGVYDEEKEKEKKKLAYFTALTKEERIGLTKNLKKVIEQRHSKIKERIDKSIDPTEIHNEELRREFIDTQWKIYEKFFDESPTIRKIVSSVFAKFLEEEMQYNDSSFKIKENLILLIYLRKFIIKRL